MKTIPSRQTPAWFLNTLGVSQQQWEELVAMLDKAWNTKVDKNRRRKGRQPCGRITAALLRVEHPKEVRGDFIVRTRDLNPTGIGLLHAGDIPVNARVTVVLLLPDHRIMQLAGSVVRCDDLLHRVHEVGVAFDQPLDLGSLGLASDPPTPKATG